MQWLLNVAADESRRGMSSNPPDWPVNRKVSGLFFARDFLCGSGDLPSMGRNAGLTVFVGASFDLGFVSS